METDLLAVKGSILDKLYPHALRCGTMDIERVVLELP